MAVIVVDSAAVVVAVDPAGEKLLGPGAVGKPLPALGGGERVVSSPLVLDGRALTVWVVRDPDAALAQALQKLHEREVLLKEIHHRVKNNLQVTSSLLNLQSARVTDETARQMLHDSRDRIRSMALAHEMLYRSRDLSTVDFGEYARSLVAHLGRSYGVRSSQVRTVVEIDSCALSLDTAVPLGLIVNELVTNAFKHAFPGERRGEVRIRLRASSDETLELTVADDGVGMPAGLDPAKTSSLGLQLVHTLTEQLEGHLELQADEGTELRIAFPRRI